MLGTTTALQAFNTYSNIKNQVNSSSLTRDQKIAVMGIVEVGHAFATSHANRATDGIGIDVNTTVYGYASNSGCNIRFRDVWRSAVVGGTINAVRGAVIAGTVGTFTVPILGTATGVVGGAVFGFAAGFITGAVGSVAEQAFWNCLLKSPTIAPNSPCSDPNFALKNLDYCNISPTRINWYLLNN
jgi:hypothetical protein